MEVESVETNRPTEKGGREGGREGGRHGSDFHLVVFNRQAVLRSSLFSFITGGRPVCARLSPRAAADSGWG